MHRTKLPAKPSTAQRCSEDSQVLQPSILILLTETANTSENCTQMASPWSWLLWVPKGHIAAVHGVMVQALCSALAAVSRLSTTRTGSCRACFSCCCSSHGFWAADPAMPVFCQPAGAPGSREGAGVAWAWSGRSSSQQ